MKNEFKRKKDTSSLKEAIEELMNTYKIDRKFKEAQVIGAWENIMGTPIANRTKKIFIANKTLYVTLTSAALKQELSLSKHKVIKLVNDRFAEELLEEVVFY